jgi:hypothetical protein
MQFLGILMPVLGLVVFAAYVWLLVVAFKESALWGVLVLLFSPITAIIFAIKYWDQAKKPFLVYVGSGAASLAIVFMMFAMVGGQMMQMAAEVQDQMGDELADAQQASAPVPEAAVPTPPIQAEVHQTGDAGDTTEVVTTDVVTTDAVATPRQEPAMVSTAVSTTRVTRRGDRIALSNIESHIGEKMRVETNEGSEFVGHYLGRRDDQLEFEKSMRSGSFSVFIGSHEIKSLEKYKER